MECLWSTKMIVWMIPVVIWFNQINKAADQISLEFSAARTKLSLTEDMGTPSAAMAVEDSDKNYLLVSSTEPLILLAS